MPTLVLLPGLDGTGEMFAPLLQAHALAGYHIKVVAYPSQQALDYAGHIAIAEAALPQGDFVLLGESFSGPIAIALAEKYTHTCKGLILVCTFAQNPQPRLRVLKPLINLVPFRQLPVLAISLLVFGRGYTARLHAGLKHSLQQLHPAVIRARLHAVLAVDNTVQLSNITCPVLYFQAAHDKLVSRASAAHILIHCPQMQIKIFSVSHGLLQVMPSVAADDIHAFMQNLVIKPV
jgi:pimeloyl-ACP methyl ester carboxylesterase